MAVIIRWWTECYLRIRMVQGSIVLLLVLLMGVAINANPQGCDIAKKEILAKGLNVGAVLDRPGTGPICGENSCCNSDLEHDMLRHAQNNIDKFLRDSITKLSSLIEVRAKKFDGFFREMMNNSKREFHDMFQKTYGKIYLQNSDVFSDFFAELETYYRKGSVRLSETLETFFGILYQRMFTVINSQYSFDEKYLECVSEHMVEMKPFGDVPHKLSMQLRRSFVATRTYYKSLLMGANVALKMANLKIEKDCLHNMTKMQYCGNCKLGQGAGACSNYCTSLMEDCLKFHTAFSSEWDNFIDALDKVADRLVGPFNIEMVVEPLNIKISEAIMNFQESGTEVSKKIYSLCGKPALNRRRKRKTTNFNDSDNDDDNPYEIKYEPVKLHGLKKDRKKSKKGEDDDLPTLEKLIREIKLKVRESRQFWLHLPYQYCNNPSISATPSENGKCWNGTMIGIYEITTVHKKQMPLSSPLVNEQIFTLQVFSDKLRKAHQGDEVEIVDDAEEGMEGGGGDDGSGSGSGDGVEIDEATNGKENDSEIGGTDNAIEEEEEDMAAVPQSTTTSPLPETSTKRIRTYSSGATDSGMSLNRALAQYLLPIVLVWFGGAISDLL